MNTSTIVNQEMAPTKRRRWLKSVAVLGMVWYAFGLYQMWLGITLDPTLAVSSGVMTAEHAAAIAATPPLAWAGFLLASAGGLVGCILLFLGSKQAALAFGASIASACVYYAWIYLFSGTASVGPPEELIIAAVVIAVTGFFLILSVRTR